MDENKPMDDSDYIKFFDLKPTELSLKILICLQEQTNLSKSEDLSTAQISKLPNAKIITAEKLSQLPLPFADQHYELILAKDLLSIPTFSLDLMLELLRVGSELRIFPLAELNKRDQKQNENQNQNQNQNLKLEIAHYKLLGGILKTLQERSYGVEIRQVQLMPGSALLRLWNPTCSIP